MESKKLLSQDEVDKQKYYRALNGIHEKLPVFTRPWWLDAVAGPDAWSVTLSKKGEEVEGVLPYMKQRKWFGTVLGMPKLTQTLGPWINIPDNVKHYKKLSIEKRIMYDLIKRLPAANAYRQNWSPSITNWQPFYWRGFEQSTRYTYILPKSQSEKAAWKRIEQKIKNNIRRSIDKHRVSVHVGRDKEMVWNLIQETFARQSLNVPYSRELFYRVQEASYKNKSGKNLIAYIDEKPIAAVFLVWDTEKMYYLASGADIHYRDTHAGSLLLWEAIKSAIRMGLVFDFEGSMIEPVEAHFRSFGAIQTPFFQIWRYNNLFIKYCYTIGFDLKRALSKR